VQSEHHTTEMEQTMEQIMESLLAEIKTNREEIKFSQ
jgi:hypothetical protein